MVFYHKLGKIPHKRHTIFRQKDGSLHHEHLMGTLGFAGLKSLLYTLRPPTTVKRLEFVRELKWEVDPDPLLRLRLFHTHRLPSPGPSPTLDRTPLLFNEDVAVSFARPAIDDPFFYRNGDCDEIIFVTQGEGILESQMGELDFRRGDYLVIPKGIIHRYRFNSSKNIFLIIESRGYVRSPEKYRNAHGQLHEHAPFCERDIRPPALLNTHDESGEHPIIFRAHNCLHRAILDHHPLDTVGWDGYYYPWAFNISDFEPITGRIHQPPPVHQTFEGDGFVIFSFVPRLFDYHPEAIPAPYNHSNIGSDEVLYYCSDHFMSRKGIEFGSITLHPDGLPHGPHPGKVEESIGKKETREEAVMIDTFRPLQVAKSVLPCEDTDYQLSWTEQDT